MMKPIFLLFLFLCSCNPRIKEKGYYYKYEIKVFPSLFASIELNKEAAKGGKVVCCSKTVSGDPILGNREQYECIFEYKVYSSDLKVDLRKRKTDLQAQLKKRTEKLEELNK
jgi:hypothetical protein